MDLLIIALFNQVEGISYGKIVKNCCMKTWARFYKENFHR